MKKGKSYSYVNIQINTNAHESEVVITLEIYQIPIMDTSTICQAKAHTISYQREVPNQSHIFFLDSLIVLSLIC